MAKHIRLSQHIVSFSHSSLQRYINFAELTKYGFWHTQMDLQASDVSGYVIGHVRWLLKKIFANMHIFSYPICLFNQSHIAHASGCELCSSESVYLLLFLV